MFRIFAASFHNSRLHWSTGTLKQISLSSCFGIDKNKINRYDIPIFSKAFLGLNGNNMLLFFGKERYVKSLRRQRFTFEIIIRVL